MNNISCRLLSALCYLGIFFATSLHAAEKEEAAGPLASSNFSATFTLTSDYIFRGVSFTSEDPAGQGSFDWGYNGFYTGVWSSNIDLANNAGNPSSQEIDFYGGYAGSLDGILDYDLMGIYYFFPDADDTPVTADYWELWLSLSHTFSEVKLQPTLGVMAAYTPDYSLEEGTGFYVKGTLGVSLPGGFGLDFGVGRQDADGDGSGSSWKFMHWEAGVTNSWKGFDFDLRYHDTDVQAGDSYATFLGLGNDMGIVDSRVVFTVSRTF